MTENTGVYIHFPFCRSKCPYCHFSSVPFRADLFALWMEGIEREIAATPAIAGVVDTLYIGGGTPSLMNPGDLRRLRSLLGGHLRLRLEEFTIEANPARADATDFEGWRDAGVDRLSVGIQSFSDGMLGTLGRGYSSTDAAAYLRAARKAGFTNIALDLMIGIPTETGEDLEDTLKSALDFGPDHVSLYILENIEGLPFEAFVRDHPPDDDRTAEAYDRMREGLEAAGLKRYEISNFALPGKECRHNLKYWRYEPFLGFGPSASSHMGGRRWTNKTRIEDWASALEAGADPRDEDKALTPMDRLREAVVFGLRLVRGVGVEDLKRRFGFDVLDIYRKEISGLRAEGMLILEGDTLRIADDTFLISNGVFTKFV